MPSLSCKSASALDSLPRNSNAKRSSTALHRLQQRKQATAAVQQPNLGEFGIVASRGQQVTRRSLSHMLRNDKLSQGVASSDLPIASSDLYYHERQATSPVLLQEDFRESEREILKENEDKEDKERDQKKSPSKPFRFSKVVSQVQSHSSIDSPPSSPSRGGARKRVVTTDMVGHPTNFKHTSSYNSIQSQGLEDQAQIQQQLSEVAAALTLDDITDDRLGRQSASKESSASEASSSHSTTATSENSLSESSPGEKSTSSVGFSSSSMPPQMNIASSSTSPLKAVAGLKRAASKRKPVPKPRDLADLCNAFKGQDTKEEESKAEVQALVEPEAIILVASTMSDEQAEQYSTLQSLSTIRAPNGKRLVQGPAGNYITDTANGRWNCALDEIKKALKSDSEGNQSGGEEEEEEEELQDGLRRADAILASLDIL